eukprot:TRINITY_DN5441_c0_g1_i3.p1 TRINITY_DN5441_c0_g1~~TRINITY_DN5441_c0_g1_i3.p1  ORF type:complete len:1170 (+),score=431.91 TRINITY_DN5441_c0_g1_i3:179-3688(+)
MSQVGIVLSPLQNNGLGTVAYAENPFLKYQKRGMRMSLGTEDPLHYHYSNHALIEEYGTAAKLYKLRPVDITEIARNSVLNSGFPRNLKQKWLGEDFDNQSAVAGNDHDRSFVPDVRLMFREDTLAHEKRVIQQALDPTFIVAQPAISEGGAAGGVLRRRSSINRKHSFSDSGRPGMNCSEEDVDFVRVEIVSPVEENERTSRADAAAGTLLAQAVALRKKYVHNDDKKMFIDLGLNLEDNNDEFRADEDYEIIPKGGVFRYKKKSQGGDEFEPEGLPSLEEYHTDCNTIHNCVDNVKVKTFAHKRLEVLEHKFALHMALNFDLEHSTEDGQSRDFYQASKVDTHIHAAAGMTARQLLDFIQDKAVHSLDDIVKVDSETKKPVTLRQLFHKMNIHPESLSVDLLNVQADASLFERFDNFNDKYNPMGNPDLRNLLLKTDNYMGGRYFAEIAKSTFAQFMRDEYTYAEMRLSIYGRNNLEWTKLAVWFDTHGMACTHNKWMVQVPRIYPIFRKHGAVSSFQDLLTNVFKPLWEVSINPSSDPKLHHFLKHVSGFDSVDNESTPDGPFRVINPTEWTSYDNPPYGYWMYFMWANIRSLNHFRAKKGLSTFSFRPHCGESGSVDHLMQCHLVADQVNHGVNLRLDPVLEYLYYLTQMGCAVSPLSNNSLFLDILDNPFPKFFRRGLNVSLSTDDPLQFHYTQEPLIEEYSIASKVWKFCANDMCEIARNSVRQSGFDAAKKASLIGHNYLLCSSLGNDAKRTHLSHIRVAYRYEVYHAEIDTMECAANECLFDNLRAMMSIDEEKDWVCEREQAQMVGQPDCDGNSQQMIFEDGEEAPNYVESPPSPAGNLSMQGIHGDPGRTRMLEGENAKLREELAKMRDMISTMQQQIHLKDTAQRLEQIFPTQQGGGQSPAAPPMVPQHPRPPPEKSASPRRPSLEASAVANGTRKPQSAGVARAQEAGSSPPRRIHSAAPGGRAAGSQEFAPVGPQDGAAVLTYPNGRVVPFENNSFGRPTAGNGAGMPPAQATATPYRFNRTQYAPAEHSMHHYNGRQVPPPPPVGGFPKIPRSAGARKPVGPMLDRMLATYPHPNGYPPQMQMYPQGGGFQQAPPQYAYNPLPHDAHGDGHGGFYPPPGYDPGASPAAQPHEEPVPNGNGNGAGNANFPSIGRSR